MLIDKTVKDFVSQVASSEPAPGGGSVSALVGSLGAALTSMVGNLTVGRKAYNQLEEQYKHQIDENLAEVQKSIEELNALVDEDTKAFSSFMEALKLPKETERDKKVRTMSMEQATKEALEVPLNCAVECVNVLKLQKVFALYGNQNAITDIGVGALLAYSGLEGALFNVKINLLSLKDEEYKNKIEEKIKKLLEEGKELKEELLDIVYKGLK